MPTPTVMLPPSDPIAIPGRIDSEISYRDIIKQLAAQTTTKPYGDIPPLLNKKKKKKPKKDKELPPAKPNRRMSHVEDWITVDSKESLPDEQELEQSNFRNFFLSGDFFTEVLPLHMPPPSLSERYALEEEQGEGRILSQQSNDDLLIQQYDDVDDEEEEEEEEESSENLLSTSYKEDQDKTKNSLKDLIRRHSISSFQKSSPTSSTTTAVSSPSSPPQLSNTDHELWKATLEKLKQTLFVTSPPLSPTPPLPSSPPPAVKKTSTKKKKPTNKLIPMPIPPRRPLSQKRRSEATTQPRFNPDTNTYTRDTRSNPDHLRMISAELNMMRGRKLLSPLKPRGFLPRRKDAFIRGEHRKPSHLMHEIK